ncbi:terminase, partial [Klebsiella pneumoniae]|nr:terminase [Klebsiella pneumoniae]
PKINQGYFAPTYPQIRDIFYPTVEEVAHDWGLKVKIVESNKEVHFYSGRQYRGTTICRSMEKPDTIVGFKIGNALVDELDVLKADKA